MKHWSSVVIFHYRNRKSIEQSKRNRICKFEKNSGAGFLSAIYIVNFRKLRIFVFYDFPKINNVNAVINDFSIFEIVILGEVSTRFALARENENENRYLVKKSGKVQVKRSQKQRARTLRPSLPKNFSAGLRVCCFFWNNYDY